MRIGLTGPNGMIGLHMKALLDKENIDCVCVGRSEWDLTTWKTYGELDVIFNSVDAVFHFGAALPKSTNNSMIKNSQTQQIFDANVRSCLNLSEWAALRKIPLIFLSGATVYQNPHASLIKEDAIKVVNGFGGFYGYSKLLAEEIFSHYVEVGLKSIILRPSSVYGLGLGKDKLIQQYLSMSSNGELIEINQPDNKINLIHAYDVAQAALSAFLVQSWGIFNIAAEHSVSIENIANTCQKLLGSSSNLIINRNIEDLEPFTRFNLDCSKARESFNFEPKVELQKGVEMMKKRELLYC